MELWKYGNVVIREIEDIKAINPNTYGFVYLLTVVDKVTAEPLFYYIGKKNLYSTTSKTATQKQLNEFPKSYFRRKKMKNGLLKYYLQTTVESNWKEYHSSNTFIKNNLNKYTVRREILILSETDSDLSWKEAKEIICNNAMEDDKFLNNNVQIKRIVKSKI